MGHISATLHLMWYSNILAGMTAGLFQVGLGFLNSVDFPILQYHNKQNLVQKRKGPAVSQSLDVWGPMFRMLSYLTREKKILLGYTEPPPIP